MRADEAAGQAPCGQGAVCSRCQGGEGSSVQGWWARAVLGPSVLLRVHSSPKCLQTRDIPTPSQRGPAPPRTWPPSSQWTVSTEAHLSRPVGPQGWVRPGGGGPGRGVGACEASELRGLLSSASPPPPDASSSPTPADRAALRPLLTGLTHPTESYSIVS